MDNHGDELRMYIVINTDAKMSKGKTAAQEPSGLPGWLR